MSQPPHSTMMPHPGLARQWAAAQQPPQPFGFPAAAQQQQHAFPGQQPPPPHFGAAPPASYGAAMPPPPTTFCAAAAAAAMCPSLHPQFFPPAQPQQPAHPHFAQPQPHFAPPASHLLPATPAAPPAHASPVFGPQLTPPPAAWEFPMRDQPPPAPSHYSNINALLGALHTERVHAGVRQRWAEAEDDEDL